MDTRSEEWEELRAIFGDALSIKGSLVSIRLDESAKEGNDSSPGVSSLRSVDFVLPEFYPRQWVKMNIHVDGIHPSQVEAFMASLNEAEFIGSSPYLHELLLRVIEWGHSGDLDKSLDDQAFLRASAEALEVKKWKPVDVSHLIPPRDQKALVSQQKEAVGVVVATTSDIEHCFVCSVSISNKKAPLLNGRAYCPKHRCSVCDQALSHPIYVGGVSFCQEHAKSSSSRHEDVSDKTAASKDAGARDRAIRQLVGLLAQRCESGQLSVIDVEAIVRVISATAAAALSPDIQDLVAKIRMPETGVHSLTAASTGEIIAVIGSFQERIGILSSQLHWISTYLQNVLSGLQEPLNEASSSSSTLETLRLISIVFADSFLVLQPSFEEQAEGITTVVQVTVSERDISLQVLLRFRESGPPEVDFGDVSGPLTIGDLSCLSIMLKHPMNAAVAPLEIIHCVQAYVSDVVAKMAAPASDFAHFPASFGFSRSPRPFVPNQFVCKTLHELDKIMMSVLQASIDDTKERVKIVSRGAKENAKTKARTRPKFELLHVENVVSSATFAKFRERAALIFDSGAVKEGTVLPMVAWHGTPSQSNVESIVRHGILAAFDIVYEDDGSPFIMIQMQHGNRFGNGIYLSPSMETASYYGTSFNDGVGQLFFSLVLLGRPQQFSKSALQEQYQPSNVRQKDPNRIISGISASQVPLSHQSRSSSSAKPDSNVSPNGDIFVVYDSAQVLPFFLVTYGPRNAAKKHLSAAKFSGESLFGETREAPVDFINSEEYKKKEAKKIKKMLENKRLADVGTSWRAAKRFAHRFGFQQLQQKISEVESLELELVRMEKEYHQRGLIAYKLPTAKGQHWMLTISPEQLMATSEVRLIFVLDKSASMGSSFSKIVLPACKHLFRAINPNECQIILFGETVELIPANRVRDSGAAFFDSLRVKLEEATNFMGGLTQAVDVILRDQEAKRKRMDPPCLFLMVIMSDGCDTVNVDSKANLESFLRMQRMLGGSDTRLSVTAINIGKRADTELAMCTKYYLDTVMEGSYEPPLIYARVRSELAKVVGNVAASLRHRISTRFSIAQSVPFEGLVKNILAPPVHSLDVIISSGKTTTCLIRGPLPHHIAIEGCGTVPLYAHDERGWLDKVTLQSELLLLLRRHVEDLSVAVLAGKDVSTAMEELRSLIASIANAVFNQEEMLNLTPQGRRDVMKRKKQLLTELRELLGRTQECLLLKTATSDAAARWLTQADKLKFGLRALRYAKRLDLSDLHRELVALAKQCDEGRLVEKASDMVSVTSRLTSVGHFKEMKGVGSTTLMEFLYSFGAVGLAGRIRRSEACVIDPWKVNVEYLSADWWDSCSALCFLEAGVPLVDGAQERCTDVIICGDPRNFAPYLAFSKSTLFRHYLSISFSRNPDLYTPRQLTAVLSIALVRSVTQLLSKRSDQSIRATLCLLYTLRRRMTNKEDDQENYWEALLNKLGKSDVAAHLTEAPEDDVGSIAKVLAVLLCMPQGSKSFLHSPAHISHLSLALMAEAASRGARIEVKMNTQADQAADPHPLLLKALGITEASCLEPLPLDIPEPKNIVHGDSFDMVVARKRSSRFFRRELAMSNCPPTAVVACLHLSRFLSEDPVMANLDRTLENDSPGAWDVAVYRMCESMGLATMVTFLGDFVLPDGAGPIDPQQLQVALYVQGLRHCTSQTRRLGIPSLRDPAAVLRSLARETRAEVYHRRLAGKIKLLRERATASSSALRLQMQAEDQRTFCLMHRRPPRVFSAKEADALKIVIDANTGLPLYVCSHEECPFYLKPLCAKQHFTAKEAAASEMELHRKTGLPVCNNKDCAKHGQELVQFWSEEARAKGVNVGTTPLPFFYLCERYPKCQTQFNVEAESNPRNRNKLYKHLKLLFHPSMVYVKSLHLEARSLVQSRPKMSLLEFVEKMLPHCAEHERPTQDSWIDFLSDVYPQAIRLWSDKVVGSTVGWAAKLSPADQQRLESELLRNLSRNEKQRNQIKKK